MDLSKQLEERGVAGVVAEFAPWLPGYAAIVEVTCDASSPRGPWLRARRQLEDEAGFGVGRRLRGGLRRRMLGPSDGDPDEGLVAALNEAAAGVVGGAAIVLVGVERADEDTLALLARVAERPGWLRAPVLAVFHRVPDSGPLRDLARALGVALGPDPSIPGGASALDPWPKVPPDVRLALRACAVVGSSFDVGAVARVLRVAPVVVLERLQVAADAGVPVRDEGDGRLSMPEGWVARLRDQVLPSLRAAWEEAPGDLGAGPRTPASGDGSRERVPEVEPFAARDVGPWQPRPSAADASFGGRVPRAGPAPEPTDARGPDTGAPPRPSSPAAGEDLDGQVRAFARAAARALDDGDAAKVRQLAARGLLLLERLPADPERRRIRIELLLDVATAAWHGDGSLGTLRDAAALAERALGLLGEDGGALRAPALAVLAGILHDLGDEASLSRALDLLTEAMRILQEAGDAVGASRLLNDQAAVWVRLGDPVRAAHLLRSSREVFASRGDDPIALRELAETEHLLARLPFHARARPGLEEEAFSAALGSVRSARAGFEALGLRHEVGRVLETEGRLLLATGEGEAALEVLRRAADLQQHLLDGLGLARTAAALADVLAGMGRGREALGLVAEAVELNARIGSPLGLAYTSRTLGSLEADDGSRPFVEALRRRLEELEPVVGRAHLPDDREPRASGA